MSYKLITEGKCKGTYRKIDKITTLIKDLKEAKKSKDKKKILKLKGRIDRYLTTVEAKTRGNRKIIPGQAIDLFEMFNNALQQYGFKPLPFTQKQIGMDSDKVKELVQTAVKTLKADEQKQIETQKQEQMQLVADQKALDEANAAKKIQDAFRKKQRRLKQRKDESHAIEVVDDPELKQREAQRLKIEREHKIEANKKAAALRAIEAEAEKQAKQKQKKAESHAKGVSTKKRNKAEKEQFKKEELARREEAEKIRLEELAQMIKEAEAEHPPPQLPDPVISSEPIADLTASGVVNGEDGLSETEINDMMKDDKSFYKCIASDEIKDLPTRRPISAIVNNAKRGSGGDHWRSLRIDNDSVEFFDPFGSKSDYNGGNPTKAELVQIKKLTKSNPKMLKLKINTVPNQNATSNNCGFISMNQLMKRNKMDFKDSTNYNEPTEDHSQQTENEIKQIKKIFGYI